MLMRPRGFSIIEFMIAITLSLLVLAALTATFVSNSRARTEIERANDQIESGRFALSTMASDLEMAGFYGFYNPMQDSNLATAVFGAAGSPNRDLPNPCTTPVGTTTAFLFHVQGYDNYSGAPALSCIPDYKAGTDVLVVRRVATCVRGSTDCPSITNAVYFQASMCAALLKALNFYGLDSNISNLNRTTRDCSTLADRRQLLVNIYYVANNDVAGDNVPTLKRAELGGDANGDNVADTDASGNLFAVTSIARGIQDLQVEYGVDYAPSATGRSLGPYDIGDGAPEIFNADPSSLNRGTPTTPLASCQANADCLPNWLNVTAVQLNVLARNSNPTQAYADTKVYTLGAKANGTVQCAKLVSSACAAFGDAYKRHVYSTTVRLNNPAGRRQ